VLQNGNLLVNQTNRLALAAATAEELDSYGDINLLRRRVINRLRSAVAAGDAAGPQVKIPVTVPALVLPENRELAARWRLEGHSKWWIAVRVAEFEFKTSLDPIKFFNEHYAGRWGYEDHKTIRLMGVMALYAATFGATVSSVLLGMLWYWRVDPAVKLAGRFSKRVNILTSAVLNMLFRDIAYVMVKKEQGDDSLPPSDPRKGGPATLPGSRISAKILSFLTFGIFGRNAVTDAIDERVIAPIKELSRFSALLALYMTDKAKYIDAVEKFFIEHGYGGESDVPAFGEEATEWTVSEREAYTLFAHALGRIMETASHSRFPKLALWRLHLKYNLSPAVTKSGMRLPMTIEGDAVEKEEIDSKQSAQTVPSKRRAGRIHLAELLSEGDEIGADFEADVVLLCGTYDFDTFDKAFELYRTGKAKKILITGGFGRATADLLYHAVVTHKYPISVKGMVLKEEEDVMDYLSFLLGRTGRPGAEEMLKEFRAMNAAQFAQAISKAGISEAGIIKQVIMQKGKMSDRKVLDRDILVETESRNTNENFRFSRVILEGLRKQMGVDTLRVAYIMAPIYQFRARAVFNHELADDVAAGRIKGTSYSIGRSRDMFDENETNNLMAAEMWRFILYTAKGDIVPEHKGRLGLRIIPWNVWKEAMMIISTSPDKQKLISRLKAVAMNLKEEDGRTLTFPNVRVLSDKLDEMGILNTEVREFVHLVYGYEPTSLVEAGFEAAQSAVLAPSGVAAAEAIASGLCPIAETAPELVGKNYFIASETPDGYFFERVQKRGELGLRVIGVSPITSTIDPNSLIGLSAYSKAEAGGKLFRVYAQKAGANGIILYYEPVAGVSHEKAVLAVAALLKDNHAIRDKLGLGDEEFDIDVIETESDFSGFENAVPEFGGRAAYFGETVGVTALSSVRAYSDLEMAEAKAGCDVVLDESRDAATQFKDVGTFTKIKKAKESVIRSHSPISVNTGLPEGAGMGEKLDSLYRKANALKIQSGIDTILLELTEQDLIDMDFGKLAGTTAALAEAGIKLHARFVVGAKTSVLEAKGTITKLVSARVAGISLDLSGIADESRIEGILRYARALNPDLVVSAKLGSISGKLKSLVDASEIVTVRDINVEAGGVIKDAAPSDARTWYQIRVRDGAMLDDGSLARLFEAVRNMGAWAVGIPMPEEGAYGKITMENVVEQVSMLVKHKIGQLAVGRIETYPQAYEIAWAMDEAGLPEEADGRITDFLKKCKGLRMAEPEAVDTMMYAIEDLLNAPRMNLPGMSAVKAYTASKLAKMQKTPDSELKKAYVEAVAGYLRGIQERVLAAQYRGTDPALASAAHQKLFGWALLEAVFTAGTVDARGYDRVAEAYRKAVPTSGSTAKDRSVLTLMDIKGFTETSSYETVEVKAAESLLAIKSMLDGPKDGFSIANAVVGVLTLVPLAEKDLSFKKTVEKKSLPAAQEGIRKLLGAA
ncbi:MAG: YdcF family protein, partial [Endomicrobiales bacterium]|nr:YdcF family protein [Endomicrobiales bacterium]